MHKYQISAIQPKSTSIYCTFKVANILTKFMVDTGAEITLLPGEHEAVRKHAAHIQQTLVQPVTVDGKPIPLKGVLEMEVQIGDT